MYLNATLKILIMSIVLVFLLLASASAEKFLILHVDAISSVDFYQMMAAGQLPNLEQAFKERGVMLSALTLFPGGTEIIVPRLKTGEANDGLGPVGWGIYDQEKDRMTTKIEVFLEYAPAVDRRSRGNFLFIYPLIDNLAKLAVLNIPHLLATYDIVEFYWFSSDLYGHYFGPNQHQKSIERFDRVFGIINSLIDDEVNLIVYGDHGMSFGDVLQTNYKVATEKAVGDLLLGARYPNIYLLDPTQAATVSENFINKSTIDFAFYWTEQGEVAAYHQEGHLIIRENNNKYQYEFQGKDPFGYDDLGYQGEYLTADQWLILTYQNPFPGAVPNMYRYLQNPLVGDVVVVITPPNLYAAPVLFDLPTHAIEDFLGVSLTMSKGNHSGLADTDLLVPVLLRGPNLEHLYHKEVLWLHELFVLIDDLVIPYQKPLREQHLLSYSISAEHNLFNGFSIILSPNYRQYIGFESSQLGQALWTEYDIFSTYSLRLFLGAGLEWSEGQTQFFYQPRWEFRLGSWELSGLHRVGQFETSSDFSLSYYLSENWQMTINRDLVFNLTYRW